MPFACAGQSRGSHGVLLAGAKNITLEGVFHSPLGASPASGDGETPGRPWYGSPGAHRLYLMTCVVDMPCTILLGLRPCQ